MSELVNPLDVTIGAREHQYNVRGSEGSEGMFPDSADSAFAGEDNWAAVQCGTSWGPVKLTISPNGASTDFPSEAWEMVVERSMDCSDGRFVVTELYAGEDTVELEVTPGWVRLHLSMAGRFEGSQAPEPVETAVERHHLCLVPDTEWRESVITVGPDRWGRVQLGL